MELSRRQCFVSFFSVMQCAVLRYSEPPNVLLIVGTEYQDGVREGRGGTGMWERAAKGDAKGKTNGCLTTKRHGCYLPRIIHELLLTTEP